MDNKFELNLSKLFSSYFKEPLRSEDFKESKNVFSIFDLNKDGKIDDNEIYNICEQLYNYSSKNTSDKRNESNTIFDEIEAKSFVENNKTKDGKTYAQLGVTVSEVFNFLNTLLTNAVVNTEPDNDEKSFEEVEKTTEHADKEPIVLTDEQKQIAKELENIPQRKEQQFSKEECEQLAQLTKEELSEAKKYFFIETRDKQLSAHEIIFMVKESKEKYNIQAEKIPKLHEFLQIKDKKGNYLDLISCASLLANRTPEEIDKVVALLKSRENEFYNMLPDEINFIINSNSSTLYNLYLNNPKLTLGPQAYTECLNRDIREIKVDNKIYRFIIGQELPEEVTRKQVGDDVVQTIQNPNLNQIQIITYKGAKISDWVSVPSKIETQHYDKDGNLEYTEFYENGAIPGNKNIYIIDKNGKRTDFQTGSVDSETGIQTVTKNYASTNGISTQFKLTANPETNEYELNYEITNPKGTEPLVIYTKHQSLKKTAENIFTYEKDGKTYNITIEKENDSENGIMHITDNSQNKTYDIDLDKLFQNEQDKVIAQRFVRMPAELLIFLSEHPLENINYGNFTEGNGHFNKENNLIEIGKRTDYKSETELYDTLFSILIHEYGHFVDYNIGETINSLSTNEKFIECFKEELNEYKANHTSEEQNAIGYFSGATTMEGLTRGCQETIAETNMLLNTISKNSTAERAYYLQRYFPKTIAFIANMIQQNLQK